MQSVLKLRSCLCVLSAKLNSDHKALGIRVNVKIGIVQPHKSHNVPGGFLFQKKKMYLYSLEEEFGVRVVVQVVTNRLGKKWEIARYGCINIILFSIKMIIRFIMKKIRK